VIFKLGRKQVFAQRYRKVSLFKVMKKEEMREEGRKEGKGIE
jgi:hypothetical protein